MKRKKGSYVHSVSSSCFTKRIFCTPTVKRVLASCINMLGRLQSFKIQMRMMKMRLTRKMKKLSHWTIPLLMKLKKYLLQLLTEVKKWLLSNITGENFRQEKVMKYFPGDEQFSPTKIFPDRVFPDKI